MNDKNVEFQIKGRSACYMRRLQTLTRTLICYLGLTTPVGVSQLCIYYHLPYGLCRTGNWRLRLISVGSSLTLCFIISLTFSLLLDRLIKFT
jgi:hypothetical protein